MFSHKIFLDCLARQGKLSSKTLFLFRYLQIPALKESVARSFYRYRELQGNVPLILCMSKKPGLLGTPLASILTLAAFY